MHVCNVSVSWFTRKFIIYDNTETDKQRFIDPQIEFTLVRSATVTIIVYVRIS